MSMRQSSMSPFSSITRALGSSVSLISEYFWNATTQEGLQVCCHDYRYVVMATGMTHRCVHCTISAGRVTRPVILGVAGVWDSSYSVKIVLLLDL